MNASPSLRQRLTSEAEDDCDVSRLHRDVSESGLGAARKKLELLWASFAVWDEQVVAGSQ
jgi:hypothetical protein